MVLNINLPPKLTNCLRIHMNAMSLIVMGISLVTICFAFIFHENLYAFLIFSSCSNIIQRVQRFLSILVLRNRTTGKKCFTYITMQAILKTIRRMRSFLAKMNVMSYLISSRRRRTVKTRKMCICSLQSSQRVRFFSVSHLTRQRSCTKDMVPRHWQGLTKISS